MANQKQNDSVKLTNQSPVFWFVISRCTKKDPVAVVKLTDALSRILILEKQ
jgi:hypothetical protein